MTWICQLPDEILLSIFKFFQDKDLVNAACVNKRWNLVTKDPQLWRSRTFEFRGYCRSQREKIQQSIQKYLSLHGQHLRKLTVLCPSPNLLTAHCVSQSVQTVLKGTCTLQKDRRSMREFHMCHMDFENTWESFRSSRHILMDSIKFFIKRQTSLRVFNMSDNFMSYPFASEVMRCLTRSKCTRTLEKLDIVDFYYHRRVNSACIGKQIRSLALRCCSLREIALNYSYLYSTQVVSLCENLQDSLQKLYLYVSFWEYNRHDEIISSKDWKLAIEAIPSLQVVVLMSFWCTDPTNFLDKAMPLTGLEIKGGQCRYSLQSYADKSIFLMNHLAKNFSGTLKYLTLNADGPSSTNVDFETSFSNFLSSCKTLEKVVISDNLLTVQRLCLLGIYKDKKARERLGITILRRNKCSVVLECL